MTLWRLLGIALLTAVLGLILREAGGKWAGAVSLAGAVLLLLGLMSRYGEILTAILAIPGGEAVGEALSLCLRVVGLAAVTEVTAGVCRDLGEVGLSTKVEWCGRAEILVVCLPTLSRVLSLATECLSA